MANFSLHIWLSCCIGMEHSRRLGTFQQHSTFYARKKEEIWLYCKQCVWCLIIITRFYCLRRHPRKCCEESWREMHITKFQHEIPESLLRHSFANSTAMWKLLYIYISVCSNHNPISSTEFKSIKINMVCTTRKATHNNKNGCKQVDGHIFTASGYLRKTCLILVLPGTSIIVPMIPYWELLLLLFF